MRRRGRVDANQKEIVAALRDVGCSVAILAGLGGGIPDLLVGVHGRNYLLEVKRDERAAKRKDQAAQREAQQVWRGSLYVVLDKADALRVVGAIE